ncbi:MAG: hypothetical protein JGK30_22970 [Microcoleus sp. PH2017_40_RAT_O_B]|uniref:hypothetical protein n=1 Tax=unclassified Microcoleus TaxID=2642155 RepID=UPI001E053365|nr:MULTISPECIES: hypothetical protein [unclassified Microcoleus]MCC3573591.1 hypothetical protein [Microcoleus sp. PH2017_34_RAT_O_A]MCC3612256.1 hypothetical protein [Microcoleus sp. PH2017_40_RAT_O_B]
MKKSKRNLGLNRLGVRWSCRWKHGRTKLVRLPVALLDEILEVARYMDRNEGRLPPSAPPIITVGHPPHPLSPQELKEFFVRQRAQKLLEQDMDEQEWVSDNTFKDLPGSSVAGAIDFDEFFELQDQERHDSYFLEP